MNLDQIKKNAPSGATHYKLMKNGKPLYFDGDQHYWNWIALKWEKTMVHYHDSDVNKL